ncbi:hypothetical protein F4808DRAFT_334809 [Astrocystis sublimbata]|nr:hypothetical protein F4808DRAFT_334809 [Astrocystis sublimbata]
MSLTISPAQLLIVVSFRLLSCCNCCKIATMLLRCCVVFVQPLQKASPYPKPPFCEGPMKYRYDFSAAGRCMHEVTFQDLRRSSCGFRTESFISGPLATAAVLRSGMAGRMGGIQDHHAVKCWGKITSRDGINEDGVCG